MKKTAIRDADLKQMLSERRRALQDEVQSRIRDRRADQPTEVRDTLDRSDADGRDDVDLTLLQMKAQTLASIDEALVRFGAGRYGLCVTCRGEIAERRLRALPFAERCQRCEETREQASGHQRWLGRRSAGLPIFADASGG